jgi:hypothetical protein
MEEKSLRTLLHPAPRAAALLPLFCLLDAPAGVWGDADSVASRNTFSIEFGHVK